MKKKKEYTYEVSKYLIVCRMPGYIRDYMVLAVNCDWALTSLDLKAPWDAVTVLKMSDTVAYADFGCRDITGLEPEEYLHYHAKPYNE